MSMSSSEKVKLVHYVSKWLAQTCVWLYDEVRFLPTPSIESHIVCDETWGLDQFSVPNIHSMQDLTWWYLYLLRVKRKLGMCEPYRFHLPLLEKVCRDTKPAILHSHFGHMGWVNAPLARKYGLKHVVSFYGADVNYIPFKDPRWLARYQEMGQLVDKVLCEGPFMAESIAKLGIPKEKISVHRLGVDLTEFKFVPRQFRKGSRLRFLIVASFREKKGIPVALEALARFRNVYDDFELSIIGDAFLEQDRMEKDRILQKVRDTELTSRVHFLGAQPYKKVLQEAYKHHIFLAPSLTAPDGDCEGGAPVAIIEMAATGMPIVSTTHCDIPFVLSRQNAPYLAEERDSNGLCEAIVRLVSSEWKDLLDANRSHIDQELDAQRQGERLGRIYQALV